MTDFESIFPVIINVLDSDADLQTLLGGSGRVHSGWFQAEMKIPCVTVIRISESGEVASLGGGSQFRSPTMQISCWAKTLEDADKISTQVIKTILSKEGKIRTDSGGIVLDAPNLIPATEIGVTPTIFHNALRYPLLYMQKVS